METSIRTNLADNGVVTVSVVGEFDYSNSDEMAQGLHDVVTDHSPQLLLVDLTDATFIDSTGLGALIAGYRTAAAHGVDFRVVNPSDNFRRVLAVTGLSDFFGLVEVGIDTAQTQATGS
ncbi:STAS domain-containing protein [Actinoplanes derwentensis]|uniref:Anti-sigma factor antagonist n=1 Tax=Actinoplanes derwentensis TaxID=113562 RepID=A0A1H2CPP2_9ACTN|nr:STAS domain-containing protein [Actinoplanes derwentensis]GID83865.1 anti-sigma factor antagonist [Actinoplanes derwentensis]SDT72495.1 anti-sigma B factor antagonist [Actinoplanes derwentensis]